MIRSLAFAWIDGVTDEYDAARAAVALAIRRTREAPAQPDRELDAVGAAQLLRTADNLEATYIVRLFADYEAVLSDYWGSLRPGRKPGAEVLMDRIGARVDIPADWLDEAHEVRELRNDIVHHRVTTPTHTFQQCRSLLARYLSALPVRW